MIEKFAIARGRLASEFLDHHTREGIVEPESTPS
jgi:hypothetical protein